MKYYYNQEENSFFIASNFIPKKTPKGFVEITKEKYKELNKETEQTDNENVK